MYIEYNQIRCGKSLIELDEIHWRFRDGNRSLFWWNLCRFLRPRFVHLQSRFSLLLLPRHHINITKATFGRSWKTIHEEDAGFKWRHKLDYSPQARPYRTVLWKLAEYRLRRLPFLLTQKIINNAIYLLNAKAFKYMVPSFYWPPLKSASCFRRYARIMYVDKKKKNS